MIESFILITVFSQLFFSEPMDLGIYNGCEWHCLTYQFYHANWIHLLLNAMSLIVLFKPTLYNLRREFGWISSAKYLFAMYTCSVIAGLVACQNIPTVGASGISFAMMGVLLGIRPTKAQLIAFWPVALCILVQIVAGHSNTCLHIVAFILGVAFVFAKRILNDIRHREIQVN